MKKSIKRIICFAFVIVLCVTMSASAFATPLGQRVKAYIMAAALASNLVLEPVGAVVDASNVVDPLGIVSTISGANASWTDYIDQSVIQVKKDVVTVDGVPYSQILLGPEAAQALRLGNLDFASAYNIANNVSEAVTYAEGVGEIDGFPIYEIDGKKRSIYYNFGFGSEGDVPGWHLSWQSTSTPNVGYVYFSGLSSGSSSVTSSNFPRLYYTQIDYGNSVSLKYIPPSGSIGTLTTGGSYRFVENPFSFDYTSGIIDAPIADDDWLVIQVPSQHPGTTSHPGYDIDDIVQDYPELPQGKTINVDPTLNPQYQTDINLGNDLGDMLNTIMNLLDLLKDTGGFKVEFNKNVNPDPEPVPAPVPDPEVIPEIDPVPDAPVESDTIADTLYNYLDSLLRWIQSTLDNLRVVVSNYLHNIDSLLQKIYDEIVEFPEALKDFFDPDWFNKLAEGLEQHAINTAKKAIDALKRIFAPILLLLKNALGIWHYVVEWLAYIGTPFSWILGVFQSAGNGIMLPIYASIAGFIVIAVYKRFGK